MVKLPKQFVADVDLVAQYNARSPRVVHMLHHVTGYLVQCNTPFGFISTYEMTWPVALTAEGDLLVGNAYRGDAQGAASVLNVLYYLLQLADTHALTVPDYRGPTQLHFMSTGSFVRTPSSVASSRPVTRSMTLPAKPDSTADVMDCDQTEPTWTMLGLLSYNHKRGTNVYKAVHRKTNMQVVVKAYSKYEPDAHDREVAAYEKLHRTELSSHIPEMVDHGWVEERAADFDQPLDGEKYVVLRWLDAQTLKALIDVLVLQEMSEDARKKLQDEHHERLRALVAIAHRHGVAHGDMKLANIMVRHATGTEVPHFFIIDWELSVHRQSRKDKEFKQQCEFDLQELQMAVYSWRYS